MNNEVVSQYNEYLKLTTGDKATAAILALAAVLVDDRATSMTPAALTAEEAARRLKVNRETVCRLNRSGKLRGCRVGGALRFPLDEIERFEKEGGAARPRPAAPLPALFVRHTIHRRRASS